MKMISSLVFLALHALAASSTALKKGDCPLDTSVSMHIPANQTALVQPATAPLFVALGVGFQNYTCNAAGTFASIGAVASLLDLSCVAHKKAFDTVAARAFEAWVAAPPGVSQTYIGAEVGVPVLLGFHYFITSPLGTPGAINAKWDFTSTGRFKGDETAFVVGAKVGDIPAPPPAVDAVTVDWLMLNGIPNFDALAAQVFRVDTVGGQPPTSVSGFA
ncbi:hypothetical protein MIND_00928000 [Mycena indigotica]|uniref:Malate dehydrogenase n=1 Tax=Mycena indigotica TaxID=2126181 RepID=A0A8H6SCE0_9AGAR|nr:uncharacterized protein MIND_00928000 [Mycena indigotica]KAF7296960.1 hypothetical protein MIND_00928000 [Mycena indigotica]